ncbi:ABC transporter permease [Arthrobacter sp. SDTb3-6]|uniref:ABC transporter permease n=1 Tax=Arthrobacter sp. SDTb3-6 TaxID=2713571 RepID=UPI00159E8D8E|nr:ABC transporter permease subunit [Arthrobacter sp. SDTb3-6]NVN00192.1 ABC transporter permease subunit [Arthrobacter sp. SDTb3-6]
MSNSPAVTAPKSLGSPGPKGRRISDKPNLGKPGGTNSGNANDGAGVHWVRSLGWKVVAIAIVLLIWQLASLSPLMDAGSLPGPFAVVGALIRLWGTAVYWVAIATTVKVWFIGLAICSVVGIPLGLAIGVSRGATRSTRWVIDFFRTIPTIALLPLVLLLFGPSISMELTLIILSAVWPLVIQSMYAVGQVEPVLKWVVKVFRISWLDRMRYLWAPSVTLLVTTGMRLAATIALLMTVSAEYIGGAHGLGEQLSHSENTFQRADVFAYALTAGLLGLAINLVILFLQRRMLWWHPITRGARA